LGNALSGYSALLDSVFPLLKGFVPGDVVALVVLLMITFIGPLVLTVVAMLILFIFGQDFKGNEGKKSKVIAYLLWFFFGFVSAHKFYLKRDREGIVYFLTGQILWFGWFINLFTLGKQVDAYNAKLDQ